MGDKLEDRDVESAAGVRAVDATQEVGLTEPIGRIRSRWHWLLLGVLLGAALAWIFSLLRPPVYRAHATLAISNDYSVTGPLDLVVEDRALDRVYQLILADDTLVMAIEELKRLEPGNPAWQDLRALRQRLSLEPRLAGWELMATDRDPGTAARIANAWAGAAVGQLEGAQEHAWRVVALRAAPVLVECFRLLPQPAPESRYWECVNNAPELTPEQQAILRAEVVASQGILPSLTFAWGEQAEPPGEPVVWDRGLLVLAGATIGLVVGVWTSATTPRRSRSRDQAGNRS
jgi:hypothetical protein